ncbi:MAG: beta-ketoacyl synthase N-terminal-like domain-containing protein, partial [Myxococcota bacterium]
KVAVPRERTGVFVGMGADAAVSGYGLRWRIGARTGASGDPLEKLRDAVIPALRAENVVGTMPNIPANRLNVQLDAGGPGFTLSAEELSGIHALTTAIDALSAGELDVALVGAVDLACDPRHAAALAALAPGVQPGDGAVVLLLQTLEAAERAGHRVWAVIEGVESVGAGAAADALARVHDADAGLPTVATPASLGSAHAAAGLLDVAAGILAVAHGKLPGGAGFGGGARRVGASSRSLGGAAARVVLSGHSAPVPVQPPPTPTGNLLTFPAHAEAIVLPSNRPSLNMAPAPELPPVLAGYAPATPAPGPSVASTAQAAAWRSAARSGVAVPSPSAAPAVGVPARTAPAGGRAPLSPAAETGARSTPGAPPTSTPRTGAHANGATHGAPSFAAAPPYGGTPGVTARAPAPTTAAGSAATVGTPPSSSAPPAAPSGTTAPPLGRASTV